MSALPSKRRAQVVRVLVEGSSIRAACRTTGAAKGTVLKLLTDIGDVCAEYHDEKATRLTYWTRAKPQRRV